MIECIVNNQKTVVDVRCCHDSHWRILLVVPFDVKTQVVVNLLGIYSGRYSLIAFVQQCQYSFVDVVVNQDDSAGGASYKIAYKDVSVEDLPVEKNALTWRLSICSIR